jgi:hypothetical protein
VRLPRIELPHSLSFTALLGVLLGLPLILNPGWYSHDELQWAAQAMPLVGAPADAGWPDFQRFQYRPLTFQLWLWLSSACFETPILYHAVHYGLGLLLALALMGTLRLHGWTSARAQAATLIFMVHPYATYVHGWVATLADLLWVAGGVGIAALLSKPAHAHWPQPLRLSVIALLTTAALLSKESALSLAALVAVWAGWRRDRAAVLAALAVLLPVLVYLGLRLPVILSQPDDATYGWSPLWPPLRLAQYFSFPLALDVREVQVLAIRPHAYALSALATLLMLILVARAQPRLALLWVVAGAAALGPVLLLASAASQYGYGLAMLSAVVWAAALAQLQGHARQLLLIGVSLVALHGLQGALQMQSAGRLSARFLPELAQALQAEPPTAELRLSLAQARQPWLYQRLLHGVPHYAGVPLAGRARLQEGDEGADLRILRDGSLQPISKGR